MTFLIFYRPSYLIIHIDYLCKHVFDLLYMDKDNGVKLRSIILTTFTGPLNLPVLFMKAVEQKGKELRSCEGN